MPITIEHRKAWTCLADTLPEVCPGATSYGMTGEDRWFFHAAHQVYEPCIWLVTPDSVQSGLKCGDILRIEYADGVLKCYVNGVLATDPPQSVVLPPRTGNMMQVITELRSIHPERCDFCHQKYNKKRRPIPDEGGQWACTVCWEQWEPGVCSRK